MAIRDAFSGIAPLQSRRLRNILSLYDLESSARRHLPRPVFEYICGGVEDNVSLKANRHAFSSWALRPNVLVDVSPRAQDTTLMGERYASPFGIAPMGICALAAYDGDSVMARAAQAARIPFILSGSSLTPMEEISKLAPDSAWFQIYVPGKPELIDSLIERVERAGYRTLVLTVDTPTLPNRENNIRAGFSTPLRPSLRLTWDGITRPSWLLGTLIRTLITRGMPHFENSGPNRGVPIISRQLVRQLGGRDHLSWQHLAQVRDRWKGKLVIKGVLRDDDVRRCEAHGADGVILSNHGGRQLDGAVSPFHVLKDAVAAKGRMAIMMDSGVRRGTDILKALCLGADFVFVGRPMVYAAAIAGEEGVAHAIELLYQEVQRDMGLLGVNSLVELTQDYMLQLYGPLPHP